jgi:hypothetical protein
LRLLHAGPGYLAVTGRSAFKGYFFQWQIRRLVFWESEAANIRDVFLWVAVNQGEPGALDFHHIALSGTEAEFRIGGGENSTVDASC